MALQKEVHMPVGKMEQEKQVWTDANSEQHMCTRYTQQLADKEVPVPRSVIFVGMVCANAAS
eukprot:1159846-Pelagomonas_calceolata.AAC.9